MHRKFAIALLIPCIAWLWACEKNTARQELERMDVKYSKAEFIKRVKDSDFVVVKLFLTAGMNPNTRDDDGTALMHAASEANIDIVQLLVEHGANVNTFFGGTALMDAAYGGHLDTVRFLVEHGADVNANYRGATALNSAAAGLRIGRNEEGGHHAEVIQFLVEHGANVNAQPKYPGGLGETALMNAVLAGNLDIVRFLVEHGADVNAKMYQNRTALTWAAQEAPPEVGKYLLEHGADPNARLESGGTALSIAEDMNRAEVVKLLKEAGAIDIKK